MSENKLTLVETMEKIEDVVNQNPDPISGITITYQFDISGEDEGTYQLKLQDGKAEVVKEIETAADCTLIMSFNSFQKFLTGKVNGTMAFMTGKLKINGDLSKAIKLESILKQYNF